MLEYLQERERGRDEEREGTAGRLLMSERDDRVTVMCVLNGLRE